MITEPKVFFLSVHVTWAGWWLDQGWRRVPNQFPWSGAELEEEGEASSFVSSLLCIDSRKNIISKIEKDNEFCLEKNIIFVAKMIPGVFSTHVKQSLGWGETLHFSLAGERSRGWARQGQAHTLGSVLHLSPKTLLKVRSHVDSLWVSTPLDYSLDLTHKATKYITYNYYLR